MERVADDGVNASILINSDVVQSMITQKKGNYMKSTLIPHLSHTRTIPFKNDS